MDKKIIHNEIVWILHYCEDMLFKINKFGRMEQIYINDILIPDSLYNLLDYTDYSTNNIISLRAYNRDKARDIPTIEGISQGITDRSESTEFRRFCGFIYIPENCTVKIY